MNGCLYTAEFHFIQNFTGIRQNQYMAQYVLLSGVLTFLAMYFQSPGILRLILHAGIVICFSKFSLKMKWEMSLPPAVLLLTLFTFMEGFQVIFMRWLVKQTVGPRMGIVLQICISGGLALLLAAALHYVSEKYAYTGQQKISSYLYALLLPCIFIVWVIRSGLGLDTRTDHNLSGNHPFGGQSVIWAFAWILGTCVIFFIILKLVSRIITLSVQETEQKRLEDQIKRQYVYLEEAQKRNTQYRMFQHDINNHFLVLSGLLGEKKYHEMEAYFGKLHTVSDQLLIGIDTGNPAVDILLNEKINFAKSNGIEVEEDVQIPSDCYIEDIDLCVILANALDNAVQACVKEGIDGPKIFIKVQKKHHFLLMEVVNTIIPGNGILQGKALPPCNAHPRGPGGRCPAKYTRRASCNAYPRGSGGHCPEKYKPEHGTGLKNIKHIVEKYEGTMEIETSEKYFTLTILLCLPPFTKGK